MARVDKKIEVEVPLTTAYNQWTQFEEFPRFMEGVKEVYQLEDERLHWVAEVGGERKEWYARITRQVPDEVLAWESEGGTVNNGTIVFHPLDDGKTEIEVHMEFEPEDFKEQVGGVLGVADRRVDADLKRFKEFLETRGTETGGWRGEIIHGATADEPSQLHRGIYTSDPRTDTQMGQLEHADPDEFGARQGPHETEPATVDSYNADPNSGAPTPTVYYVAREDHMDTSGGIKRTNGFMAHELPSLRGQDLYSADGEKLGEIEDVFLDDQTGKPEWVRVKAGGFLKRKSVLVPVDSLERDRDHVTTPYSSDMVKDAPEVGEDYISPEEETVLYQYYGLGGMSPSELNEARGAPEDSLKDPDPSFSPMGETPAADREGSPMIPEEKTFVAPREDKEPRQVRLRKWTPS